MVHKTLLEEITLLLVEDDPAICALFGEMVAPYVKKLLIAHNGLEGLEYIQKESVDILLSDIDMPVMNGLEMITEIRAQNRQIPIIILSRRWESDHLLRAISSNVSGYLTKPIDFKQLYTLLETQAKTVLFEKERIRQNHTMQRIIDTDPNMIVIIKRERIRFANKTFLEFFACKDLAEFNHIYDSLSKTFVSHPKYLNIQMLAPDEEFTDLLLRTPDHERIVSILDIRHFTPRTFLIKLSLLNEEEGSYLWHFIDITDMTLEKIKIEDIAYHDKLTGIYNRQKMDEIVHYEMAQQKRYHTPLSFAILDIDHFKKVNDTYGHQAGDEVLIHFARTIEKELRQTDSFARWGGEEFVVLLTHTELEGAMIAMEKLREAIASSDFPTAGKITASFGVTQIKEEDTFEEVYQRADAALYAAKKRGRDRVEAAVGALVSEMA